MDDLRQYFESIQKPFEEKLAAIDLPDHEEVANAGVPVVILLVVLLPFLSDKVVRWVFVSHGINVSTRPFWVAALVLMFLGLFVGPALITAWTVWERYKQRVGLPDAQMRFALCQRMLDELGFYQRNRLDSHLEEASRLWRILAAYLYQMLCPGLGIIPLRRPPSYDPTQQITRITDGIGWIKLAPESNAALEAFKSLAPKVSYRLQTKTELAQVSACLLPLCCFLYTLIPDRPDADIHLRSDEQLALFSRQVLELPWHDLVSHPSQPSGIANASRWIVGLFNHQNVLPRFFCWYTLLNVLFALGFLVAQAVNAALSVDNTILAAWIGTPLIGAVTAAAIIRQKA